MEVLLSNATLLRDAEDLPSWVNAFKSSYLETSLGQFIVHGNVHDVVFTQDRSWSLRGFFDAFFEPGGKLIVHYDPSKGIYFPNTKHAASAGKSWVRSGFLSESQVAPRGIGATSEQNLAESVNAQVSLERTPDIALEALEHLLLDSEVQVALVLHYAELIAPAGGGSLSFSDRTAAARLHRWSLSEAITRGNNVVFMLVDSLPALSTRLARNPRVLTLKIALPNEDVRSRFVASLDVNCRTKTGQMLTRSSAGLQLRQLEDIVMGARARDPGGRLNISLDELLTHKKQILEQECQGLIEVIQPGHDFSDVGGMSHIKNTLMRIAEHVIAGRRTQVPMGVLCVGPMGTGKTFLAEAFARESGLSTVKLKNFRDRWVGSTEANLEKVLTVIEALGEILVIIDEGDRSIGGGSDSDGGVNSRVIARLKEFMSDTSHRGRIIFMMMTNRPDKLDTDMKRPGRFDLKIPFFVPQSAQERALITRAVIRRNKISARLNDEQLEALLERAEDYSAAELEAVVLLAFDDVMAGAGDDDARPTLTMKYLDDALHDFMPTRETKMIEYMQWLAISEASNRRLLPQRFESISVEEVQRKLAQARLALAEQSL
jgi:transitional endoplasmic reticulum ATPase